MRSVVILRVILATLLLVALSGGVALAAGNDTPETAVVVSAANPSGTGTIVGGSNSTFRYYRFSYPGADTSVIIHLTWNPGFGATDAAFNFNVYGPNGLAGRGERGEDVGPASTSVLNLRSQVAGDYLVQVYNYTPATTSAYTLDFTGLGAPPVTAVGNTTPGQAIQVEEQAPTAVGTLTGQSQGAFRYFTFGYPGVDWETTISVTFKPARWIPESAFGFNVYDGDTWVTTSAETSRGTESVTAAATVKRFQPGTLTVQLYNYVEGVTAEYQLGIGHASGATVTAVGNDGPDRAITLTPQLTAARGTLGGNGRSSFNYYGFNYQGDGTPVTMSLQFSPSRDLTGDGVGFNIYKDGNLAASSLLTYGRNYTESLSYLTFTPDTPGYYGIMIYSYAPQGMPVNYTFYCMGLE
ncbi:MAG: hypothetical protein ACYC1C_02335 [Chloroflexota bacterium]